MGVRVGQRGEGVTDLDEEALEAVAVERPQRHGAPGARPAAVDGRPGHDAPGQEDGGVAVAVEDPAPAGPGQGQHPPHADDLVAALGRRPQHGDVPGLRRRLVDHRLVLVDEGVGQFDPGLVGEGAEPGAAPYALLAEVELEALAGGALAVAGRGGADAAVEEPVVGVDPDHVGGHRFDDRRPLQPFRPPPLHGAAGGGGHDDADRAAGGDRRRLFPGRRWGRRALLGQGADLALHAGQQAHVGSQGGHGPGVAGVDRGGQRLDQPTLHTPVAGPVEGPGGLLAGPDGRHRGGEVGQPGAGLGDLARVEGRADEGGQVGEFPGGVGLEVLQGGERLGPGQAALLGEGDQLRVAGGGGHGLGHRPEQLVGPEAVVDVEGFHRLGQGHRQPGRFGPGRGPAQGGQDPPGQDLVTGGGQAGEGLHPGGGQRFDQRAEITGPGGHRPGQRHPLVELPADLPVQRRALHDPRRAQQGVGPVGEPVDVERGAVGLAG